MQIECTVYYKLRGGFGLTVHVGFANTIYVTQIMVLGGCPEHIGKTCLTDS